MTWFASFFRSVGAMLRPAETIEVDSAAGVECNALGLEQVALDLFECRTARARADLAPRVDHPVPGHIVDIRQSRHRVADLSSPTGQPCLGGDSAVGCDAARGDPASDGVELVVGGH